MNGLINKRQFLLGTVHSKANSKKEKTYIDNDFIMIMLKGSQTVFINDKPIDVPCSHYIHVPPNSTYHSFNKEPCIFLWIHIYNHDKKLPIKKLKNKSLVNRIIEVEEIFNILQVCQAEGSFNTKNSLSILHSFLSELVSKKQSKKIDQTTELTMKAKSQLLSNFKYNFGTKEIADILSCSPDYLGQIFKSTSNQTITEFINQMRIIMSKRFLKTDNRSIAEIGKLCGFNDATYFNRVFKKISGETPTQYRKRNAFKKSRL